ncbi:hypothetical protein ANTRET_LOCUS606 [Anthophora retusa]
MGLPPTSPRLKFTHTHPGGSPVPRRPPRHPPSPSTRSRSLELLDQDENKTISPVREPEKTQTRPRSRSLDGLLDEDSIMPDMKTEESPKPSNENKTDSSMSLETLDRLSDVKAEDILTQVVPQRTEIREEKIPTVNIHSESSEDRVAESNEAQSPKPVPRQRVKPVVEVKPEPGDTVQGEEAEKSPNLEECSEKETPMRPSKPNRFVSVDGALSTVVSCMEDEKEYSQTSSDNVDPCDSSTELKERLVVTGNDKSTLLKARSCGAGLDSDESISSNEYKPNKSREQGSLLSLPTGAEPKRKKNFMDKCVNKVRSFMRK